MSHDGTLTSEVERYYKDTVESFNSCEFYKRIQNEFKSAIKNLPKAAKLQKVLTKKPSAKLGSQLHRVRRRCFNTFN